MTLQTVILAAGMGSRLGRSLPKPLTELNDGRSIMRQQHDNVCAAFGTDARIMTVVGHKAETIVEPFPQGRAQRPAYEWRPVNSMFTPMKLNNMVP